MPIKNLESRREYERQRRLRARSAKRGIITPSLTVKGAKRRCDTDECSTVLSIYNVDSYCAKHLPAILRKNPDVNAWL